MSTKKKNSNKNSKYALINGKIADSSGSYAVTNLLIEDSQLIGKGYLPDDTDATVIDCSHCYVLPTVYCLSTDLLHHMHHTNIGTIGPWSQEKNYNYHWLDLMTLANDPPNPDWEPLIAVSITLSESSPDAVHTALETVASFDFPIILRWGSVFIPERFTEMLGVLHHHGRRVVLEAVTTGALLTTALTAKRYYPTLNVAASLDAFFESDASYFVTALEAGVLDALYSTVTPEDSYLMIAMIAQLNGLSFEKLLTPFVWGLPQFLGIKAGFALGYPAQYTIVDPRDLIPAVKAKQAGEPLPPGFISVFPAI